MCTNSKKKQRIALFNNYGAISASIGGYTYRFN